MTTHKFDSTGEAYDACQCDDDIKTGDTLVAVDTHYLGKVTGRDEDGFRVYEHADKPTTMTAVALAWAWPVAVTEETGEFHSLDGKPGALDRVKADAGWTDEQIKAAVAEATKLGATIAEPFKEYAQ